MPTRQITNFMALNFVPDIIILSEVYQVEEFLNQAHAPDFLELLLSANVCMRVCVCVSAPEAINN